MPRTRATAADRTRHRRQRWTRSQPKRRRRIKPERHRRKNQPVTSTVILPTGSQPALTTVASSFTPPAEPIGTNQNDLNLNFKNAPLDMVLNYMSDAAGLMIVLDTRANGTVSVIGKHVTRDEAVDLLNSELNKSGYAAIRKGRTLTIVDKNDAKTRNIPS